MKYAISILALLFSGAAWSLDLPRSLTLSGTSESSWAYDINQTTPRVIVTFYLTATLDRPAPEEIIVGLEVMESPMFRIDPDRIHLDTSPLIIRRGATSGSTRHILRFRDHDIAECETASVRPSFAAMDSAHASAGNGYWTFDCVPGNRPACEASPFPMTGMVVADDDAPGCAAVQNTATNPAPVRPVIRNPEPVAMAGGTARSGSAGSGTAQRPYDYEIHGDGFECLQIDLRGLRFHMTLFMDDDDAGSRYDLCLWDRDPAWRDDHRYGQCEDLVTGYALHQKPDALRHWKADSRFRTSKSVGFDEPRLSELTTCIVPWWPTLIEDDAPWRLGIRAEGRPPFPTIPTPPNGGGFAARDYNAGDQSCGTDKHVEFSEGVIQLSGTTDCEWGRSIDMQVRYFNTHHHTNEVIDRASTGIGEDHTWATRMRVNPKYNGSNGTVHITYVINHFKHY